ncbi:Mif2/CENP-C like-domain-containing protein [Crepidotus variabilis]|uniref:CENP-C homolog n=1 Tax=Crepidotus variabilis TaxID=179855 RepID=A0A9P6EMZ3_9AGAR|nr:Mif2/CENP-C like-domain-containing protein [Crepidotus variabilis]
MPTSARKSSTGGARRLTQKAHIPYRGDNPEVGKKTGIAVGHVERKSDGFEPFEEVMQRADGLTPPRKRVKRKSVAAAEEDDYDDYDGEQSMQIDSPVQQMVNHRPPVTPPSARRRSSVRPVARTSDVNFDDIPSPRPNSAKRGSRHAAAQSSNLSRSNRTREREPSLDSPNEGGGGDYSYGGTNDMDQSGFDDYDPPQNDPPSDPPGETSFSRMNEDEDEGDERRDEPQDEEEEEDQEKTPKASSKQQDKGKAKATEKTPRGRRRDPSEDGVEDEIAQGMDEVDLEPDSDGEQEERPTKKSKVSPVKEKKVPRETESRKKKENRPQREGVRKSKRKPMKPFAYWRGERYVYGKPEDQNGPIYVPNIKEIIRIPEEPHVKLRGAGKRKRSSTRPRSRSRARSYPDEEDIPPAAPVVDPEEGWDDDTEAKCVVQNYTTREEVERRIAWTAKMVEPRLATDRTWSFDKIFGDDDFIAAGQLVIPPKGRKPSKAAKDNTYVFYVIEGAVNFKIHNQSMVLATGGMFMVPRGNTYFIENICNRDARLFFTQARKVVMNDDEKAAKAAQAAEAQRRKSLGRSSSVGAPPTASRAAPNGRAASLAVASTRNT